MNRVIPFATLLLAISTPQAVSGQIGGLIKKKAADALKQSAKKDSAKAPARPDSAAKKDTAARTTSPAPSPAAAPAPEGQETKPKADPKVWDNYDFVPGNKVLAYTDFSEDRVGNFARGLKYVSGPAEVVERDGIKVLRATGAATFLVPLGRKLPQRFTLEIDVIAPLGGALTRAVQFEGGAKWVAGPQSAAISWNPRGAWYEGSGQNMTSAVSVPDAMRDAVAGSLAHVRVLMDSGYFKMYVNERRLYNIPELAFHRDSVLRIALTGAEEEGQAVYVTSIRVAESETDVLYDALNAKGRWVTQGILFATGRADLQPESRPVLKEIAATLKQHGDLKILIEGHTDNVGAPASNLALSDARAAAVKAALVSDFGVDGGRITTRGLGDTKPAVPNATATGRAQNRRVEVVKQ